MSVPRTAAAVDAVVKAYDVRGIVGEQIDAGFVRDVGTAFARLMAAEGAPRRVVVGHDMRSSSPELAAAFAEGVTATGSDVTAIGLASTDELYFASGHFDCPGAMFTASHNPARYNGIKLCRAGAKPVGTQTGLATIRQALIDGVEPSTGPTGTVTTVDLLDDYARFVRDLVSVPNRRRLTVAVDAGNGMAGHTAPAVFAALPVDLRPLYFELDGTFPNHEANPLDPKNLVDLQRLVVETKADIGLAFDGDADRCFVVDETGAAVSPSTITSLVAERELAQHPGATIIHNLITSRAVPELITELGGKPLRTRVGHSYIKQAMAESGAVFGGEHSAHYYFRDFFGADSGMVAALHVLSALEESDGTLSELTNKYVRYASSGEINSTVVDQQAAVDAVLVDFADRTVDVDTLDGHTVTLDSGAWFNLRPSNTEPLLRLNVEAADDTAVRAIVEEVLGIIRR